MAKDYLKGKDWRLFYDADSDWMTPTWEEIFQIDELGVNFSVVNIEIAERGRDTKHLHGNRDPAFVFTLKHDKHADATAVAALIKALNDDANMLHLAVAQGDIVTNPQPGAIDYWEMDAVLFGDATMAQDDVTMYEIEAYIHGNSTNELTESTTVGNP